MVASVLKLKAGHMEDPKGPIIDPYSIPSPLDVIDSRLDSASSSPTVSTRGEKKKINAKRGRPDKFEMAVCASH